MQFLYLLEQVRMPWLNKFMLAITHLGDETAFLVISLILFWCIDKRHGYYILSVGFLGTITNQFMKLWFRIPRPWVLDENFTILEQAREGAAGYSFPSGHTQTSVGTFAGIALTTKWRIVRIISILLAILVPFSRMYVGVHTPLDVSVAAAMAIVFLFVLRPVVLGNHGRYFPIVITVMGVLSVGFLAFVECFPFPADIDPHNLASGVKNAYTLIGCLLGLLVVYTVDEKWLKFPVHGIWWAQVLKVVIGLLLVLAIKSGLKTPLDLLLGDMIGRAVRYFLIVIMAGILWPLSFRWFASLGQKQ